MLPVIAGVEGMTLSPRERELFTRLQPAGYILFSRNIEDAEQVRELTDELRQISCDVGDPIIAIDQEGGRVVRTAAIGVQLPAAATLAQTRSTHSIRQAAAYNARCLLSLGINTNFAPVLDLGSEHANALPSRCWGTDTQDVISYAGVWNRMTAHCGIMTCGKHFPGMGAATCDPHSDLPVLHGTRDDFLRGPGIPFTALMPELPSLMIAHLLLPEIDADHPSSLSRTLVQGFLRDQLGFEGVVFTDDLCMGAITHRYTPEQAVPLALRAGCDLPLVCHDSCEHLEAIAAAVRTLPCEVLTPALERIERFRMQCSSQPMMPYIAWRDFVQDVADFSAGFAPADAVPGSPVQDY